MKKILVIVSVLLLLFVGTGAKPQEQEKSVVLEAVEDAYVVTDASTNTTDLRDTNYGSLDFLKNWYAWKVQGDEQLISLSLVKFDLTPIKDKEVQSVTLQLFATRADLTQAVRLVDVNLVSGAWSEKDVTFNKRPDWGLNPVALAVVYGAGGWYSWDVSGSVAAQLKKASEVSFVLGLRAMDAKSEEQVVFASREAGTNAPRLIVTYTASAFTVPWWVWVVGIVVVAAVAFFIGRWLTRRSTASAGATKEEAANTAERK